MCDSGGQHGAGAPQHSCVPEGLSVLLEQPRQLFVLPSHSGSLKAVFGALGYRCSQFCLFNWRGGSALFSRLIALASWLPHTWLSLG